MIKVTTKYTKSSHNGIFWGQGNNFQQKTWKETLPIFRLGVMDDGRSGLMEGHGERRAPKRARPADERLDAEMKPSVEDVDKVSFFQ